MGTTTVYHLPYPELADPADAHASIKPLADAVDAALGAAVAAPAGMLSGECAVWNGTTFVRSTVTRVNPQSVGSGTRDGTRFLRDDGVWASAVPQRALLFAYDVARLFGLMFSEGVSGGWSGDPQTALFVGPGSGLQVSVAAGYAFVQGDDAVGQGLYAHYAAGPLTAAVTSNGAGNPRVDAVVLRFNDSEATSRTPADTPFNAHVEVIAGTATSGANLTNLSGHPATPPSALLLAYLLVPSGAGSFSSGSFLDQRKITGPAIWSENSHRYREGLDSTGTLGWEQIA